MLETFIKLGGTLHIQNEWRTEIPTIELIWGYYQTRYRKQHNETLPQALAAALAQIKHQILHNQSPETEQLGGTQYHTLLQWAKK